MKTLGKFAVYKGKEYQFTDISDGNYSLISEDEKDTNIGFQEIRKGRYSKDAELKDLDFIFKKIPLSNIRVMNLQVQ